MQIVIPIVTLVVGAVLSFLFTVYRSRPLLTIVGSGGGGGSTFGYATSVRLQNRPGLMGLRLSETTIFGRPLHGYIERGLTIERNPARECIARLHDKGSGEFVAQLWWRRPGEANPWPVIVNLASGEEADLMLFARVEEKSIRYFPFEPADQRVADARPKVPPVGAGFVESRDFYVEISYSYGRQRKRFDASVIKGYDGRLSWRTDAGGGSF